MMIRFVILCFCIATLFYSVVSEVIDVIPCEEFDQECIKQVRVLPCKEAKTTKRCKVKRASNVSIEVDFEPNFNSEKLKSQAYWDNGIRDLPFLGMDTDACKTTTCPIVKGNKQTYSFNLNISPSYPPAPYTVKWKLTGDEAEQERITREAIEIVKPTESSTKGTMCNEAIKCLKNIREVKDMQDHIHLHVPLSSNTVTLQEPGVKIEISYA